MGKSGNPYTPGSFSQETLPFPDQLILQHIGFQLLNVLANLTVDCGIVQQVNHQLLFLLLLELAPLDCLSDTKVEISH